MKRRQTKSNAPPPRSAPLESADERAGLISLALLSLLAGAASGLVGAAFRLALLRAHAFRDGLITWAHGYNLLGMLLVVALAAAATALAAWLVRRFAPAASGSGIPHVEAVLHQKTLPADFLLLPVKFVGGLLAIGAGLALGREGPSVQMGASVAHFVGRVFRRNDADARILLAAGAGAGLATAFSAPIAGSVFVLEELMRRFDTRITIATLGASAAAIGISRLFLGVSPDFPISPLPYPAIGSLGLYLAFGVLVGIAGIAYNRAILGALAVADRYSYIPVELRAATVGASVGLLAWFYPNLVGGGDNLTANALDGTALFSLLPAIFALRFALGAVSYAAGTPGGLFAPLLVLGAQSGLFFGTFATRWFPHLGSDPTAFAVTGMAAFFTAVVRCPVTGIILVIELTASDIELLPMLAACFTAMLVPTLTGNPPIYDSLGALSSDQKK
jgi:CIC family chloride channel protein